ncbi:MAG: ABC transporter ATP-binding protein [Candidatus Melainabacteria bacterium]|nr:ABC transporter ATP-binding protein [Candidatus Melainabacteria bacterium]
MDQSEVTTPWLKTRKALRVLAGTPRVLKLCFESNAKLTIGVVILNTLLGLGPLAEIYIVKLLIDFVTQSKPESFDLNQLALLLGALAVVRLLSNSLQPTLEYIQELLGDFLTKHVKLLILNKTSSLAGLTYFENPKYYDQLVKAQNESGYRPLGMLFSTSSILRSTIGLVSMLCVLLAFQPLLVLLLLVLSLPHLIAQFRHQDQSWSINDYTIPEVRRMDYFGQILTMKDTAKELRIFGLHDYFIDMFKTKFGEYQKRRASLRFKHWRNNILLSVLAATGMVASYGYVIYRAIGQSISIGSLSLYLGAITQVQFSLETIIWSLARLYEANLYINNLFEFLALKEDDVTPVALSLDNISHKDIVFDHVTFAYPESDRNILDDISFILPAGKTVALVGENGAGKTTVVKLLSKMYSPTKGTIKVGDKSLVEIDPKAWRKSTSVIFQDFNRYHMTAQENIGIGQVERIDDIEAIKQAAIAGGADEVVDKLDKKYDTLLGLWFATEDKGADLSGGEWQKLALARTFMRTQATKTNLLILDEPTAALDPKAEHEVFMRFHELTKGRTTLLISHRFSTVRMADLILLLENGKIIESGSHDELMKQESEYSRLFNLQAEKYK